MAKRARDRWRSTVYGSLVGARFADWLRAHLHSSGRRLPASLLRRQTLRTDIPRRPRNSEGLRRGFEIRQRQILDRDFIGIRPRLCIMQTIENITRTTRTSDPSRPSFFVLVET